jgi:aquaporin Z
MSDERRAMSTPPAPTPAFVIVRPSSLIARRSSLLFHLPEYAIEALLLGAFMLSACLVSTALEHPDSPLRLVLPDAFLRRALIGIAMGLTAISLIYSPWGQRSGAHFNPSVTLTYLRLGKIAPRDALGYVAAQCVGGVLGVLLAGALLGMLVAHPAVAFAATTPGRAGAAVAFGAELAISFGLMTVVLWLSNSRWARWTGCVCGALVATYITVEAPLSGMSMNPARSLASALVSGRWDAFWLYVVAPPLGMLAAAELYLRLRGARRVFCAKLRHGAAARCIFHCNYAALTEA